MLDGESFNTNGVVCNLKFKRFVTEMGGEVVA
jgi:hypothetical protein